MIAILDYGLGNVKAFANIYRDAGIDHAIVSTASGIDAASHIIVPGVGAFDQAVLRLNASGMVPPLRAKLGSGTPVLGVCVGMQVLLDQSDEGTMPGLAIIAGRVRRFPEEMINERIQIPHMGWNDIAVSTQHPLFDGVNEGPFYFLHSYFCDVERDGAVMATTDYGKKFACAAGHGSAYGVQFHPEKSHGAGVRLLTNFAGL